MEKIELEGNLPWGLCAICSERMRDGASYDSVTLPTGQTLVHAYCAHREVGASMLMRPGKPTRWRLITPIEQLEWREYLAIQMPMLAGALQGLSRQSVQFDPPETKN